MDDLVVSSERHHGDTRSLEGFTVIGGGAEELNDDAITGPIVGIRTFQ